MAKKDVDFSDLSEADRMRLVVNTALIAQESGGLHVMNANRKGTQGVLVWIPGYTLNDGQMNVVEEQ